MNLGRDSILNNSSKRGSHNLTEAEQHDYSDDSSDVSKSQRFKPQYNHPHSNTNKESWRLPDRVEYATSEPPAASPVRSMVEIECGNAEEEHTNWRRIESWSSDKDISLTQNDIPHATATTSDLAKESVPTPQDVVGARRRSTQSSSPAAQIEGSVEIQV
eukprot:CAMPEP_0118679456 /NCGR_PEP_ID=MMETSP0800-20121206/3798_1 /TAXON_ID=210618 ORGANISM="Striatella unipunctata, Strain CCMP2910" /NCGR_SAMPLE_ID=MMETSP0800 /ASSEMBLY_ACC=CAM_ASM_000638 /LENGTH=159 /DNA_ID=CAMNT_0006575453 /DNA_START=36 /DNA_END=515 /DNA_ORIENTATION=+